MKFPLELQGAGEELAPRARSQDSSKHTAASSPRDSRRGVSMLLGKLKSTKLCQPWQLMVMGMVLCQTRMKAETGERRIEKAGELTEKGVWGQVVLFAFFPPNLKPRLAIRSQLQPAMSTRRSGTSLRAPRVQRRAGEPQALLSHGLGSFGAEDLATSWALRSTHGSLVPQRPSPALPFISLPSLPAPQTRPLLLKSQIIVINAKLKATALDPDSAGVFCCRFRSEAGFVSMKPPCIFQLFQSVRYSHRLCLHTFLPLPESQPSV